VVEIIVLVVVDEATTILDDVTTIGLAVEVLVTVIVGVVVIVLFTVVVCVTVEYIILISLHVTAVG